MNSRRSFLKTGGLAVAGSLVLGGKNVFSRTTNAENYFSLPSTTYSDAAYSLGYETFEPLINTTFQVGKEGLVKAESKSVPKVVLRLVEVVNHTNNKNRFGKISQNGFSLIFEAENGKKLEDKIYQITHPQTGEFPLFVSTVGRSEKRYQAVFSRIL